MLDVFFTVDVEIWCDGWHRIDERFADSFKRYIYGPTAKGNYGLPYTLDVLSDHGLTGVFFVEPLFSRRFGSQPLAEIVGLLREDAQEIQLHLHTEWVDEAIEPLLAHSHSKRQHLHYFSPGNRCGRSRNRPAALWRASWQIFSDRRSWHLKRKVEHAR